MMSRDPLEWYYMIQLRLQAKFKARSQRKKIEKYIALRFQRWLIYPLSVSYTILLETMDFVIVWLHDKNFDKQAELYNEQKQYERNFKKYL